MSRGDMSGLVDDDDVVNELKSSGLAQLALLLLLLLLLLWWWDDDDDDEDDEDDEEEGGVQFWSIVSCSDWVVVVWVVVAVVGCGVGGASGLWLLLVSSFCSSLSLSLSSSIASVAASSPLVVVVGEIWLWLNKCCCCWRSCCWWWWWAARSCWWRWSCCWWWCGKWRRWGGRADRIEAGSWWAGGGGTIGDAPGVVGEWIDVEGPGWVAPGSSPGPPVAAAAATAAAAWAPGMNRWNRDGLARYTLDKISLDSFIKRAIWRRIVELRGPRSCWTAV